MGQIHIRVQENSTIEVQFLSLGGKDNRTVIYNSEILRQFNVNRILFNSNANSFLRQPTIDPPDVNDFIKELRNIFEDQTRGNTPNIDRFVNEFIPRLVRPEDLIIINGSYIHRRNGQVIFLLNFDQLDSSIALFDKIGSRPSATYLLNRIKDYVLNVRRR
jgi:hypothetical protein